MEWLNKEIAEFISRNNRDCEIVMGTKTHNALGRKFSADGHSFMPFDILESMGRISKYRGMTIVKGDFEYGYYLR
jgi:hypothetical protein